jgi:hypothetical protein
LLFSGHMVDLPRRKEPRFPQFLERAVEKRIAAAIRPYAGLDGVAGFASAARGADIMFHEQCRAAGIPTMVIIPFSPETFVVRSVAGVPGEHWERRFWDLWEGTPEDKRKAMMQTDSVRAYESCNMELVRQAEAFGAVHLIAFWNRMPGDGPGGTASLVAMVEAPAQLDIFTPQDLETS